MIRIAIQAKGRLNEQSIELLRESGVSVDENRRKFLTRSESFPLEVLYLRDDDIPQAVSMGAADLGIVGLNEVAEKGFAVDVVLKLGFGGCRVSLAVPKSVDYSDPRWFEGRRVATSYPRILKEYFAREGVTAEIHEIAGSVEIAPAVGMADAIFDIVSSGGTLVSNGLVEVEKVLHSEAVLIARPGLEPEKQALLEQLKFRVGAALESRGMKYLLMNLPTASVERAIDILPAMRSPTVMPLAQEGWCSLHSVVRQEDLWNKIEALKAIGAEGILVLALEKIIK
ncbi:MAG: ATP phosphoribosyltransferase [Alistipes sp.]|jgi:ATP phosphoribosyltransferase|nr:ATP phosphoribosyltransferase [Alistipes sp.]